MFEQTKPHYEEALKNVVTKQNYNTYTAQKMKHQH